MNKVTKFLFASALSLGAIPISIFAFSSTKEVEQVKAEGQYNVGFAIKGHADVYFEETGNSKVQNTKTGLDGKLVHLPELYRTDTLDYRFDGWYIQNTDTKVTLDTVFESDTTLVDRWTYTPFDVDHKVSSIKINNPELAVGTKQGKYTASAPTVNVDGVTGGTNFVLYKGLNKSGDPLEGDEEVEIGKNYSAVTTLTLKSGFKFDDQLFPTATNGLCADYKYRGNMWLTRWSTSATQIEVVINFVHSDDYYFTQQPESREFENYTEYHYWYSVSDQLNDGLIGVDLQYYEDSSWNLFGPATMVVSPYANKTYTFRLVAKHEHGNVYSEPWTVTWSVLNPTIDNLMLGVNTPQNGETPNYTVTKSDNRFNLAQIKDSNTQNGVKWTGSTSGDLTVNSSTFNNSEDYTVSIKLVAQEGYAFNVANLVATINARSAEISGDSEAVTISYTFEKAAQIKHKVYFICGLHGSGSMDSIEVVQGAEYTLPESTFTPDTNYQFAAWSVEGELKKPGDAIVINSDIYVFATWQASSTPASYGFSVQPVGGSTAVGAYITVPFEVDGGINFDQVHALVYDEQTGNWDALIVSRDLISYKDNGRIVSVGLAYDQMGAKLLRLIAYRESIQVALSDTFVVNWNIAEMSVQPVGATVLVGTSYTFTWKTNFDARFRILRFDGEDWGAIGETTNSSYTVTQNSEKSLIYQVCADIPFKMANGSTNYVYDVAVSQTFIVNWVEAAPTEYVVNYAPGEGSGSGDMDYVEAGSTITLKTPQELGFLAPDGKVFDAWQINGVKYDAGASYTVNADTYITALWKDAPVQKYTVTYKANGGTGSDVVVENIEAGSQYTLITFVQSGFTAPSNKEFDCWKVNGVSKQPGETITVNENTTVLANWKDQGAEPEPTYTVSFSSNGGTGTMADVPEISGEYTLPANGFTAPEGQEFAGWKINGEGDLLQPGDSIEVSSNVVLVAQWEDIIYHSVTFDVNGGSGEQDNDGSLIPDGSSFELPDCTLTAPEGKEFDCWEVDGGAYNPGDFITMDSDKTIKAVWKDKAVDPVDPEPVTPTPTPSDGGGETTPEQPAKKKGCGGSVIAASALISIVSLAGTVLLFIKRKQD